MTYENLLIIFAAFTLLMAIYWIAAIARPFFLVKSRIGALVKIPVLWGISFLMFVAFLMVNNIEGAPTVRSDNTESPHLAESDVQETNTAVEPERRDNFDVQAEPTDHRSAREIIGDNEQLEADRTARSIADTSELIELGERALPIERQLVERIEYFNEGFARATTDSERSTILTEAMEVIMLAPGLCRFADDIRMACDYAGLNTMSLRRRIRTLRGLEGSIYNGGLSIFRDQLRCTQSTLTRNDFNGCIRRYRQIADYLQSNPDLCPFARHSAVRCDRDEQRRFAVSMLSVPKRP